MNHIDNAKNFVQDFIKESIEFVKKCEKPNRKKFTETASSCAIGFAVMGIIGFLLKLLFLPISNMLLA